MTVDLWEEESDLFAELNEGRVIVKEDNSVDFDDIAPISMKEKESIDLSNVPKKIHGLIIRIEDEKINLYSSRDIRQNKVMSPLLDNLYGLKEFYKGKIYVYQTPLGATQAYVFRHLLKGRLLEISENDAKLLKEKANKVGTPRAELSSDGKSIELHIPKIKFYQDFVTKLNGYPLKSGVYRIRLDRALDLETLIYSKNSLLPIMDISADLKKINREPIKGFDGTLDSLKNISVGELNIINSNSQTWKSLKKSKETLTEKIEKFGIKTLYDLVFNLPKRFIDKSNPQDIGSLFEGESVSVVGIIKSVSSLPKNMGIVFSITDETGYSIRCCFWRQEWLRSKFNEGDEVLITGKVGWFGRKLQLNGSSIEHADEASLLPIVPIYKQSESKGVTTKLLMSAERELFSRINSINLPKYLESNENYNSILSELHFPSSLESFKEACDRMAFQELVYMQLLLLKSKENSEDYRGISKIESDQKLQSKAIKTLPFKLTNAQVKGIEKINEMLSEETPHNILLNADVGAGKSVVAQLVSLRAIEAGYQVAFMGPTEILSQQLKKTFDSVNNNLPEENRITIGYISGGMKAAEKKTIIKELSEGNIDVIVGTTSVLSDKIKFKNLGLVVIDEQQKFGVDQREKLLDSRGDGSRPDLLMMTATPIPRSTAQIFYGDMDLIILDEKPPGRIPIQTEWIKTNPVEMIAEPMNPVWADVIDETKKGNQTFIINPLVKDSEKIDAASVEKTYKTLSGSTLSRVKVGFIHGNMKKEEQNQVMSDFRDKKLDVLVASIVIEVGVDIPDATRMIILSADRLGASTLHQIRGRVGRSNKESKCFLISEGKTENSQIRLQSLVDSDDGFDIALSDLSVRGEGTIFGTDQSGSSEMIFASLVKHKEKIDEARILAEKIMSSEYKDVALEDARNRYELSNED